MANSVGRPRKYSKLARREIADAVRKYGKQAGKEALKGLGLHVSDGTIELAMEEFSIKLKRGHRKVNSAYFLS